jgi:hypothetical protein
MMDYETKVRESVARNGFHVTSVGGGENVAFSYSTGIFESYDLPELIISALPPNLSYELISQYIIRFRETPLETGYRIEAMEEKFDYYLIPVSTDRIRDYMLATFRYYGEISFRCLQLVYPDTKLRFPHEDGYDYDQELFGTFPPR